MTAGHSEGQPAKAGRHTPPRQSGPRRNSAFDGAEHGLSAQIAAEVGDAARQLGARLGDPAIAHSVEEIAEVTHGFSVAVEGMADGLGGITEWLRASGHAGPLSGHASVVADRLGHVADELARLTQAINQANRQAS